MNETPESNDEILQDIYGTSEQQVIVSEDAVNPAAIVSRGALGGLLMGLANLVPGISGGTMLLAAGIYPQFIDAIADVTRFRFRFRSLLVLASVAIAAGLAILLLAGLLKGLVVDHRWVMYSLFIGLTLGGVPIVWKLARPATTPVIVGATVGLAAMILLAYLQEQGIVGSTDSNFLMMFIAGLAGASAMILPGLSGGYLLLLLGQYVNILGGVDQFKEALKARDMSMAMEPAMNVVLPVGLGVVAGIVIVGNLLQWLFKHFQKATCGVLLGLLIGSVFSLWPFKEAVQPNVGDMLKGQVITTESIAEIDSGDWPNRFFQPQTGQVIGSLALIGLGFAITMGVAALGQQKEKHQTREPENDVAT